MVLLNNDTEVENDWLGGIEIVMCDTSIGTAQPRILFYDNHGIIVNAGGYMDKFGYTHSRGHLERGVQQFNNIEEIFYAAGTAMIIRSSVIKEVGLLDLKYLINLEDLDLSWRIRLKGYRQPIRPEVKK